MSLKTDLETYAYEIFVKAWDERNGTAVPSDASLTLANDGIHLNATVLYADLADSTVMVDERPPMFAAEVYKAFLYCASRVIRHHAGEITAFDGDRVMAVFIGEKKNTRAVKAALQINWVAKNVVQAKLKAIYKTTDFVLNHVVGIDTSKLFVARTGIRGSNDLVWVGRAANYAAKLAALPHERSTYITAEIYNDIDQEAKRSSNVDMWKPFEWDSHDGRIIYGSTYWWALA